MSDPGGGLFVALEHVRDPDMLRGLAPAERHVLLAIAVHVGRSGLAWPSLDTIAELTGYQRRSVIRIVARLVAAQRLLKRQGGGHGRPNYYLINPPPYLEMVIHNGDPESLTQGHRNEVTVTETVTETVTGGSPQGEGEGVVLTNRDSDSRAAPPWVTEGITLREWQTRERRAGRLRRYKQADHR